MILSTFYRFIIIFLISTFSFAQGEADNWFFGANAGLNFSSGFPQYIQGGQINTLEGCASISDPQGLLLFYTDGSRVWDKNNNVMPNGSGLFGDDSSTSSGLIVPSPGSSSIYYIFTVDEPHHLPNEGPNRGLNYSVVDLNLNGGNGDIVSGQKNISLVTYNASDSNENKFKCSEKITAVRSADCNSFWVVTHFINKYYSFKIDNLGVDSNPVISTTPTSVPLSGYRRNALGYLKASPDGLKLAVAHLGFATNEGGNATGGVFLYDFNPSTGIVSNELEVYNRSNGNSPYGVEFSRSGEKLYASVGGGFSGNDSSQLIQYDLSADDIISSETIVNTSSSFSSGAIQIAPDGKIYRALFNFNNGDGSFLGVVNNPELAGIACNYVEQGFSVNNPATAITEASRIGLPPFIQSLFAEKVDIIDTDNDPTTVESSLSLCEGDTYTLSAEEIPGALYTWTLDGNPIADTSFQLIDVGVAGVYLVEVDPNNGDCPFFGEATIAILPLPIVNSITPLESCFDPLDSLSDFDLSETNTEVLNGQLTTVIIDSYHVLEADALSGANPISTLYSSSGETIYIRLRNTDTDCVVVVPFELVINTLPVVSSIPVSLEQCDTDSNGIVAFNLNEANVLLSANSVNENFVYYNSLSDAQLGDISNAVSAPTSFQSATGVSLYATITNDKGCVSYGQLNLIVGTSAIPSSTAFSYAVCDDDYDGISLFDFSDVVPQITSIFPSSVNISISYYENEEDALSELNAIQDISNHQNTNSLNSQSIWVRVDSQDLNGCLGLGEHIFLTVDPLPTLIEIDDLSVCSDTQTGDFDLTNVTLQAQNGDVNLVISYHETPEKADSGLDALNAPYLFESTTLFIRAENSNTGCYTSSMSVDLIVNVNPSITSPNSIELCDDFIVDGFTDFNLFENVDQIIDDSADFSVLFYTNESEAILGSEVGLVLDPYSFTNTENPQDIYVRVENMDTGCFSLVTQSINVLDKPQGVLLSEPFSYCDTDTDGIGYFDLNSIVSEISGGLAPGTVTVDFFETLVDAELGVDSIDTSVLYENNNTDNEIQTLYAKLSIGDLECSTIITVDLLVLLSPEFDFTTDELTYEQCADVGNISGQLIYDLIYFAR
ncbi:hypothetical protein OAX11_01350, partial [Flavobacteriaceae bacterium]|nr:hypothetical protein [Flavobacteriaceae bacterium]